jgi:hypothetical protein
MHAMWGQGGALGHVLMMIQLLSQVLLVTCH